MTLNVERSGEPWMSRFHPHPEPQDNPAVPLPSGLRVFTVNAPTLVASGQTLLWPVSVAVPVPAVFSVKVTSEALMPQPVWPKKVICQEPVRSEMEMLPCGEARMATHSTKLSGFAGRTSPRLILERSDET